MSAHKSVALTPVTLNMLRFCWPHTHVKSPTLCTKSLLSKIISITNSCFYSLVSFPSHTPALNLNHTNTDHNDIYRRTYILVGQTFAFCSPPNIATSQVSYFTHIFAPTPLELLQYGFRASDLCGCV